MTHSTGIGLDGCRNGWVCARVGADGTPELRLLARIEELERLLDAQGPVALVDIPIGLTLSGDRPVDAAAKALLNGAASSVFTIPPRCVFDALDFAEAQRLARAAMGKGFSIQAWNILPKIREVDLWLRRRGGPCPLRESHPELVFRGLARMAGGDAPAPLAPKKTADGQTQRMAILAAHGVDATSIAHTLRTGLVQAAVDDVLDAVALATAARAGPEALTSIPPEAVVDPLGLPMEMVVPRALLGP